MFNSVPWWMMIVGFLLVLGPLVTIHELGHYLVGRLFGVKAEAFSVGFGKELAGWTDKRGTRWKLSALPLGGYVQFKGDMDPASIPDAAELAKIPEHERSDSFHHQPLWQRALIVFAGPAINLIVAVAIFAGFALMYGKPVPAAPGQETVIAAFAEESAARDAGLLKGDRIVAIDGEATSDFQDVVEQVMFYPGRTMDFTVERSARTLTLPVTITSITDTDRFGNESRIGKIGVQSGLLERVSVGPGEAMVRGVDQSIGIMQMMVLGIQQIVTGERSVKELGGPIKIAKFSGEQLSLGGAAFIWFVALISINLAFINLLPIPALDGGHLAFYAVEAVRRKPAGARATEYAYRVGIALVLMLMIFVTVNDVISLPVFSG